MVKVLGRVTDKRQSLTIKEVMGAWESRIKTQYRLDDDREYMVAIGVSPSGRLLELIAFEDDEDVVIFHAMKATKKILIELNML
jgi:hypothetical protein